MNIPQFGAQLHTAQPRFGQNKVDQQIKELAKEFGVSTEDAEQAFRDAREVVQEQDYLTGSSRKQREGELVTRILRETSKLLKERT